MENFYIESYDYGLLIIRAVTEVMLWHLKKKKKKEKKGCLSTLYFNPALWEFMHFIRTW